MLSISNVTAAHASHYYEVKDNYYTKTAGQWYGKGADMLNLHGDVLRSDFDNLLNGNDAQGQKLIDSGVNGKHRAGFDLTFSAPKSMSILGEILGENAVYQIQERVVRLAMEYAEKFAIQARKTVKRQTFYERTGNLIAAIFPHDVSREVDPQIHTHCVIINMTRRADQKWRAISNEELYQYKMVCGQIYRNELALQLKSLGYEIDKLGKGLFEIRGMPEELIQEFSKRTAQVRALAQELALQYPNEKEPVLKARAAKESRLAKKDVIIEEMRKQWMHVMHEKGYDPEGLLTELKSQQLTVVKEKLNHVDQALEALTENQSVLSKREVIRTALRLSLGEKSLNHILAEFHTAKTLCVVDRDQELYTNHDVRSKEFQILRMVQNGKERVNPLTVTDAYITDNDVMCGMTKDQQQAFHAILASEDKIMGIQGDAGTGKTYMLGKVTAELEHHGCEVLGLSMTGKAVSELESEGIIAKTLDAFLLETGGKTVAKKQMFIIDEASMLGSRKFHAFLQRTHADDHIVLVGDTKQLQAIEAGGIFQKLQEHEAIDTVQMKESCRFSTEHMKYAAQALSAKQVDKTFTRLERKRCISVISNRNERLKDVTAFYMDAEEKKQLLIVVKSNNERIQLNDAIRKQLRQKSRIKGDDVSVIIRQPLNLAETEKRMIASYEKGAYVFSSKAGEGFAAGASGKIVAVDPVKETVTVEMRYRGKKCQKDISIGQYGQHLTVYQEAERSFAKGDRIVFLKNDKALQVQNSRCGTIERIDDKGNIKVKTDKGKMVMFNASDYAYFDHGYAVTDYKSQGQTTDKVLYIADTRDGMNYNSFYVAVTRGREDIHIFTNDKEALREQVKIEQCKLSNLDYAKEEIVPDGANMKKYVKMGFGLL